jgi:hypothetical protein
MSSHLPHILGTILQVLFFVAVVAILLFWDELLSPIVLT